MENLSSAPLGSLAIFGSTGSIGTQALDIVRRNSDRFQVVALTAHRNVELLRAQIEEFSPKYVCLTDSEAADQIRNEFATQCEVLSGPEGLCKIAVLPDVHTMVAGIVGFAGLEALLEALRVGTHVALANKEALIAAGGLIRELQGAGSAVIAPVDSEHNSLFQCMLGRGNVVRRVTITASGGPFLNHSGEELSQVTVEQAVKHPNWDMGAKISVDSATLMNKGLEVIEAAMLFDLPAEKIEVLVHPQSIVHGFVEYQEGTTIAALYHPDMRVPIGFALEYLRSDVPDARPGTGVLDSGVSMLDLVKTQKLEFYQPDLERFPALALAYRALTIGDSMPAVLNAANEIAVEAFCERRLGFCQIAEVVEQVIGQHQVQVLESINDITTVDAWARDAASNCIEQYRAAGTGQLHLQ